MNMSFRGDIELMRGVAVTLVVLFHLKLAFIPSGFVGVDMFFVISGYLMAVAFSSNDARIIEFYERRARRVLPAAMVIMLVFFAISPFIFLPFEAKKISEPFWGMIFFAPNLAFWKIDDYFSALVFSPTLHYWSLGVELQYYLVFPLLVYFLGRKPLPFILVALTSLIACVVVTRLSSKTAFFFLPFRLWEFLAGYFAFALGGGAILRKFSDSSYGVITFAIAILGLIIYSLVPVPQNQFPGIYALVPVLLTSVAITTGLSDAKLNAVFGVGFFRWIGKISYSIYLVHFIVIFVFMYSPFSAWKTLTIFDNLAAVCVTLLLSALSYKYLEIPFRNRKLINAKQFWIGLLALYLVCASVILIYGRLAYFSSMREPDIQKISNAVDDIGEIRCGKLQKLMEFGESSCYLHKSDHPEKTVYLVGDSHMDAIKHIFVNEAVERKISVRLNRDRCFLGVGQCSSSEVIKQIKAYKVTDVVMHGYAYENFDYGDLQRLIDWASENKVALHFIGPVPSYSKSIPESMYEEYVSKSKVIESIDLKSFLASVPLSYVAFREANKTKKGVYFYYPENYFCEPLCKYSDSQNIYYYDGHHLTLSGASFIRPIVSEIYSRPSL